MIDSHDGTSYATGLRIDGQHCTRCGQPDSTRQRYAEGGLAIARLSACCSAGVCFGYVVTEAWVAKANPERTAWACDRGVADRNLGEPTWLPYVAATPSA